VRQSFNTADFVAPYVVFDIGGNANVSALLGLPICTLIATL
jgi:hypothetical protein